MSMEADGYGAGTIAGYGKALASFTGWLGDHSPDTVPAYVTRDQVRGRLVELRRTRSQNTARTYFTLVQTALTDMERRAHAAAIGRASGGGGGHD